MSFWRNFKGFIVFVTLVVILASCSLGAEEGEAPVGGDTPAGVEAIVEETTTTVDSSLPVLEFDVAAPSTTVSEDPELQYVAELAHWYWHLRDDCSADLQACDLSTMQQLTTDVLDEGDSLPVDIDAGLQTANSGLPMEFDIKWVEWVETEKGVNKDGVLLFSCRRMYNYEVVNGDESDFEKVASASGDIQLYFRTDDGWKLEAMDVVVHTKTEQTPENGDEACNLMDDFQVPDEILQALSEGFS